MINTVSDDRQKITGGQIRAARALLRWTAEELAERSKLGVATIRRAEAVDGPIPITLANADTIVRAFEEVGIEFINGDAPGVRLHPRPQD
jgi:transcriptional regulator with XRE-family HTH domain